MFFCYKYPWDVPNVSHARNTEVKDWEDTLLASPLASWLRVRGARGEGDLMGRQDVIAAGFVVQVTDEQMKELSVRRETTNPWYWGVRTLIKVCPSAIYLLS